MPGGRELSPSSVLDRPVVGDLVVEGVHPDYFLGVVGLIQANRDDGFRASNPLHAVPNSGGNGDELVVVLPQKKLVHFAASGRAFTVIVKDALDHAAHGGVVERDLLVEMPSLDHTWVHDRKIGLPKAMEYGPVPAKKMHDAAPLVANLLEWSELNVVDHGRALSLESFKCQTMIGSGMGTMNFPPRSR